MKLKNFLTQHLSKLHLIFLIATFFFFLQHFLYHGWDFSVYVLNAQYMFADGNYFELSRAPLMSVFLGIFSFLGWKTAEYMYILFASTLFFFSSIFLARTLRLNELYFYLFSANAFVLLFGLVEGTELLALALLELFLVFLIKNKWYAGMFLGFVCLTRYPLVVFFPLLFFHKGWKMKIISVFSFVLPFIPWFVYNKIYYGNIFSSIADSYALNILYREYVPHTINFSSLFFVANILLPFIILGIWYFFSKRDFSREYLILGSAILFILYSVYSIKADVARYYIYLTIPFVFFSVYGIQKLSEKKKRFIVVIFILFTVIFTLYSFTQYHQEDYSQLLSGIKSIDSCALQSNVWVPLSYQGRLSEPFPSQQMLNHSLNDGYYIIFYYDAREPMYITNSNLLHQYPILLETEKYIVLGEGCKAIETVDKLYIETLNYRLDKIYNYTISEEPCEILFKGNSLCIFVNDIFTAP
ncbi:MAG: hypothetical protein Q8R18_00490 [bacterium]|nr:hypothetical protein [bacterium]